MFLLKYVKNMKINNIYNLNKFFLCYHYVKIDNNINHVALDMVSNVR